MEKLTFDDVLIKPKFSTLKSRKDVDLSVSFKTDYSREFLTLKLPILSANMDTVTWEDMAAAMSDNGALGVLHRFASITDTKKIVRNLIGQGCNVSCAIGLGEEEQQRALALAELNVKIFTLDVAHGAQQQVVEQYKWLKETIPECFVIVGNFATGESCSAFWAALNAGGSVYYRTKKGELNTYGVDAFKIGIGPGSACTTRIKTGIGIPQLSAILDVANCFKDHLHKPMIIADGGMRTSGDIAKALAAGADCVMLGGMLAGTDETPGELVEGSDYTKNGIEYPVKLKKYRGSASSEAYTDQNKDASHRTAEGEAFWTLSKGPVAQVLQDIEGGLRSAFTYVGAKTVKEFQERAEFVKITSNSVLENKAHGKL